MLAELAGLEKALGQLEAGRVEGVARVEREAEVERGPLSQRREELTRAVERFCRRQKPALDWVDGHERRSRRLRFGRVGWRASQAVVIRDEAAAMKGLAGWPAGRRFLRVQTEIDREGLREFLAKAAGRNGNGAAPTPSAQGLRRRLSRAGIRMEQREKWFYEIDWEAVRRWGKDGGRRGSRGKERAISNPRFEISKREAKRT